MVKRKNQPMGLIMPSVPFYFYVSTWTFTTCNRAYLTAPAVRDLPPQYAIIIRKRLTNGVTKIV
jgi:hypothetical protein